MANTDVDVAGQAGGSIDAQRYGHHKPREGNGAQSAPRTPAESEPGSKRDGHQRGDWSLYCKSDREIVPPARRRKLPQQVVNVGMIVPVENIHHSLQQRMRLDSQAPADGN